ncbi:hypothetical protein ANTHONY_225 [Bacillus phage Anthony]|uniref:Uncharacterized protein n=2 Tax=Bastillevirus CAM003 TaxID=1918012 RepID=A0A223LGW9_9CAUD|nr:hypothetical protein ANTHONY_225 [Bacillus phage Anthony]
MKSDFKGVVVMTVRTIIIPIRDKYGFLRELKEVTVEWNCPTCGEEMGYPELHTFFGYAESYTAHAWDSPCGHIVRYLDLKEVQKGIEI